MLYPRLGWFARTCLFIVQHRTIPYVEIAKLVGARDWLGFASQGSERGYLLLGGHNTNTDVRAL